MADILQAGTSSHKLQYPAIQGLICNRIAINVENVFRV